jgi:hypothetical protein
MVERLYNLYPKNFSCTILLCENYRYRRGRPLPYRGISSLYYCINNHFYVDVFPVCAGAMMTLLASPVTSSTNRSYSPVASSPLIPRKKRQIDKNQYK